ncbi:hypothetical protein RHAL1_00028 [Beijerinckiaceae bacterium RH AL1]|nr:TIGR04141 family sporadically distributed protein [Beijerinckiaceae bacterium]VVB42121.1 hypothetical protein RHAL8_00028 [Beijerinckiaceae bacterium RH AL8]VVB42122.1 hypothetical protein RHCH11_RHCH11_00028 [Beijerinckiaceae bacterium RH CH11]VVC53148.1 hypothetical protein RHAL1_00028 [Beijerinckiaceae bacterium RH AL1]
MSKTRNFSIFLIKEGRTIDDIFGDDSVYDSEKKLEGLPEDSTFFLIENEPRAPWWVEYFPIEENIAQSLHGAIYVLNVAGRMLCICFGQVSHLLDDDAYEHDFGIRVTLNCVDPQKLKSTDTLVPGPSLRQKTQIPLEADLTYFDFDYESDVLKSLTGKVKEEFNDLFRHATGASNLRIGSTANLNELGELCSKLIDLYKKNDFEKAFPGLRNISPVKDPSVIHELEKKLIESLRAKSLEVNLMVPDIINYHLNVYASFSGSGASKLFDEVYIGRLYEFLENASVDLAKIDMEMLKKLSLCLADENETISQKYNILKYFIFDPSFEGEVYHLRERQWYKVDKNYIAEMRSYLDPLMGTRTLPSYEDKREGDYNQRVAQQDDDLICMDMASISPVEANKVEPYDLYSMVDKRRVFIHVKVSTLSATLSHLFNQGVNPIHLLRSEHKSQVKLHKILEKHSKKFPKFVETAADDFENVEVCYAIITRKDPKLRSDNFPLFSRISLMRAMKTLKAMSINGNYIFVKDASPTVPGKAKPRKPQKKTESATPF